MSKYERAAYISSGSGPWTRWVVGSTSVAGQHLVVTTSPHVLRDFAKLVNGPGWYPEARVRPITTVSVRGWKMQAVFVPQGTNDGSAFAHHVVLIWTVGQHTYGLGFHDIHGLRETLQADEEFARHVDLVGR